MDKTYHALLIGLNKYVGLNDLSYAEKDAKDLYGVLTDEEIGLFPEKNVTLLIGEDANWQQIRENLEAKVLKRASDDTILVYYAGHSVIVDDKVYLLSTDLSVEQIEQNKLTYSFMSLIGLRDSVLRETKARNVIVILDTCQSGAIISNKRGENLTVQNLNKRFDDVFQNSQLNLQDNQSRSILVSSPPTSPSMEDVNLENGLFTYCILDGLKGGVQNTSVTVDSLIHHVKEHKLLTERSQIPGSYSFGYGQVLLSKPKISNKMQQTNVISIDDSRLEKISKYPELNPFSSPLEEYITVIEQLLETVDQLGLNPEFQILESIRTITNVSKAFLLKKTYQNWDVVRQDEDKFTEIEQIFEILAALKAHNVGRNAFSEQFIGFQANTVIGEKKTLILPIDNINEQRIIVLMDNELISKKFSTNIFGHIIRGLFHGLEKAPNNTGYLIKAYLLDYLKNQYRYLPKKLYDIRHTLFIDRLNKMSVKFQPIICFSMNEPYISGVEALASDYANNYSTPHDLFDAAELWGDHFKIHVDQYFFEKSVDTYVEQLKITPGKRRPEDILDISINVYPESLMRSRYFEKVKAVMDKKLLPKRKLHLEISEKTQLPQTFIPGDGIVTDKIRSFRDVLYKYVSEIGIGFSIDDFGVGHSSVSRLAQLTPSYLKIDREILKAETASQTLRFIMDYAHTIVSQRILESAKIVVEGFDEEIHNHFISLNALLDLGVEYIQGYIIGTPTEKLVRLDQENRQKLFNLQSNNL